MWEEQPRIGEVIREEGATRVGGATRVRVGGATREGGATWEKGATRMIVVANI